MEDNIKIISEENCKKNDIFYFSKNNGKINKYMSDHFIILNDETKNKNAIFMDYSINKNKKQKIRNAGIDIIRIIGMYGIIITHLLYLYDKGAIVKYSKYSKNLRILHCFFFWHNNGFALLSGIVGYKSFKYSNLFYLWFDVTFYSVSINLYFKIINKPSYISRDLSKEFFPIIYKKYWYFSAYFGMYLFLPAINAGISCLNKKDFCLMNITIIFLFVFWRDIKNPYEDVFDMKGGLSLIWLISYYLIGAYIGKNRTIYSGTRKYIYCLIFLLIYIFSNYLFIFVHINEFNLTNESYKTKIVSFLKRILTERFDSILKVVQSISISLIFLQINYNKYISKIICFLGPLAFGIYLIHNNFLVKQNILKHSFENEPKDISLNKVIILILFKALKIFIFCIIIDYFRHLLFILFKIRKICIMIEKLLRKIFY